MTAIREARPDERAAVANVLDGASLAVDHDSLGARLAAGDVLGAHDGETLLGALVLDPDAEPESTSTCEIAAVAVRRRRRGQGIGTALVAAAMKRCDGVIARFDAAERAFYERLGFTIEAVGDHRYRGVSRADEVRAQ